MNLFMCAYLLQNGALWDIKLLHYGIGEIGVFYNHGGYYYRFGMDNCIVRCCISYVSFKVICNFVLYDLNKKQ